MIDNSLIFELDASARKIGGIDKLPPDTSSLYINKLAKIYNIDPNQIWWWESLNVPALHFPYGDGDGLSLLSNLLEDREDGVTLIVTDDEQPPWPIYAGRLNKIISILRENRFFEYIISTSDMSLIIFDTHMNELIAVELVKNKIRDLQIPKTKISK